MIFELSYKSPKFDFFVNTENCEKRGVSECAHFCLSLTIQSSMFHTFLLSLRLKVNQHHLCLGSKCLAVNNT